MTKSWNFWTTYPPPLLNVVCERPLILDKDFLRYGRNTPLNFKKCNDRDCGHGSKHDLKSIPNYLFFWVYLNLVFDSLNQSCILLNYISVISSKFINKFAQKCQYFTLMDQRVPLITVTSLVYLGRNRLCLNIGFVFDKSHILATWYDFECSVHFFRGPCARLLCTFSSSIRTHFPKKASTDKQPWH